MSEKNNKFNSEPLSFLQLDVENRVFRNVANDKDPKIRMDLPYSTIKNHYPSEVGSSCVSFLRTLEIPYEEIKRSVDS